MVIGLTGGIGTGKSTVSQILRNKGFSVIDLDVISHKVIEFPSVVEKIVRNFGKEVLENNENNNDGNRTVSREKLGKIIFSDREKRFTLNSIMHPEILRIMHKKILECESKNEKENKIIFVEIQLLFEVQWEKEFDYILLVAAKRDIQVRRVLERDKRSEKEAWDIINSQMSLDEKRGKSDFVIENDGNIDDLNRKVDKFLKILEQQQFQKN
jgi:dephospho-coA kinase